MSRKFKAQASSARAASAAFGSPSLAFGHPTSGFHTSSSPLSYVTENPDLSGIPEPNVVVAFKNLGKKDSVTKAKALEELHEHLSSTASSEKGVESSVLEAWINIYPRTSIDNSRRVRRLAHSLQGTLTVSNGKRILPYLPKVVGPWLSGIFDSDKSASRSAQDALQRAFTTEERRRRVWTTYQKTLVEYAEDALLVQTSQSLSDERITNPDDAEAKHVRVVVTSVLMLNQLVLRFPEEQSKEDNRSKFNDILGSKKLWEYAYHEDPSVRRAIYALVVQSITCFSSVMDWKTLSSCFLAKTLHRSQLASSCQYTEALLAITREHPMVWTDDYAAKTTASKRLLQFLKLGSQRGPEAYWSNLAQLLPQIPLGAWANQNGGVVRVTLEHARALLSALHDGVASADEPRTNAAVAWHVYVRNCFWVAGHMDEEYRKPLLEEQVLPIVQQYISPSPDQPQWHIPLPYALSTSLDCIVQLLQNGYRALFQQVWTSQIDSLVETMKKSLPESSKDFKSSQDALTSKGDRLFALEAETLKSLAATHSRVPLKNDFENGNLSLVTTAVDLLRNRNGKPYGAAALIGLALDKVHHLLQQIEESSKPRLLDDFLTEVVPRLLESPSSDRLIGILFACRQHGAFQTSLDSVVHTFVEDQGLRSRSRGFHQLLQNLRTSDMDPLPGLDRIISDDLDSALSGDSSRWSTIKDVMGNASLQGSSSNCDAGENPQESKSLQDRIFLQMMKGLSIDPQQDASLQGFIGLLTPDPPVVGGNDISRSGSLLAKLLLLCDSPRESTAERAALLTAKVKKLMAEAGSGAVARSTIDLIKDQLDGRGQPLSILGLVDLAEEALRESGTVDRSEIGSAIFPTKDQWQHALAPFLDLPPAISTAITSPLQGLGFAIPRRQNPKPVSFPQDADDFSLALRLALYVTKLLTSSIPTTDLTTIQAEALYFYCPQALQLVKEKLGLDGANDVWTSTTLEVTDEMVDLVSQGQALIVQWVQEDRGRTAPLWLDQLQKLNGVSAESYNLGVSFTSVMSSVIDIEGASKYMNVWTEELRLLRSSDDLVKSAAIVVTVKDSLTTSSIGKRLCNELVADATALRFPKEAIPALRPLVLLNLLISGEEDLVASIPTQRLVFLVKSLVQLLQSQDTPYALISESLKLLSSVLPSICEIYGEHWEEVLQFLNQLWRRDNDLDDDLPTIHSSLKLYRDLKSLAHDDSNEDLVEAWDHESASLTSGLLRILKLFDSPVLGANQPRAIVADLLRRQLSDLKLPDLEDLEDVYPLLASEERAVQEMAYELLHQTIPAAQENRSLTLALDGKIAHLPDELISLLLPVPTTQLYPTTHISKKVLWLGVRRYLLGWKIIFDHFTNASYKLQEVYAADIKESGRLSSLLDLICDIIKITGGRPVDASKIDDIESFDVAADVYLEKGTQHLSIHLYYLCLLRLPSVTKDWYFHQKNRTKSPLETWTSKHISPLIVASSLRMVSDWSQRQEQDEDRHISLKMSPRAAELVASIEIDEESPPISLSIVLPGAYPLEQAVVSTRNRVGVSEKHWQSWLRTFQVIIFGTGSLIEGLIAFRRNVQGALKGQSECAICYSIIGTDMQTPNKRCGTCKNNFHSVCLFRWFKSSNSSSCPLCRNNFNYA